MPPITRIPAENVPQFQYEPLDRKRKCIRLLEVLRPGNKSIIECSLRTYTTEDAPPYVALSYTWDRDNRFEYIACDGRFMRVGRNVWDVLSLYQFRATDSDRCGLIWIDAICIDQDNIGERNHQVEQMSDIYSGAKSVIVWLGQSIDDAEVAFHLVRVLEEPLTMNGDDLRRHTSLEQWRSIAHLLERPYWTRVWIAQEFIPGKSIKIWCGAFSISGFGFNRLAGWLHRLKDCEVPEQVSSSGLLVSPGWKLFRHRTLWWQSHWTGVPNEAFELRNLLANFAELQSSDTRDKVYGFFGFAVRTSGISWSPDYSKTVVEILVQLVRVFCQWGHFDEPTKAYWTISLIKRTLEVTDVQLAAHVLKHSPDLQSHLHILVPSACVLIPLQHVSTVTFAGCKPPSKRRVKNSQLVMGTSKSSAPIFENSNNGCHFTEPTPDLGSKLQDHGVMRALSLRSLKRSQIFDQNSRRNWLNHLLKEEQTAIGWMRIQETSINWSNIEQGDQIHWFNTDQRLFSQHAQQGLHYTSFTGTNGVLGLTFDHVKPFDCIFTIATTETMKSALLLRPFPADELNSPASWHIVGTAALFAQEAESELPWIEPVPDQDTDDRYTIPEEVKNHCFNRVYQGVNIMIHPVHLREMFRCGLLGGAVAANRDH